MKKIFTTIGMFTLLGLVFLVGANAYMGDPSVKGPNYNEERHQQMLNVFETGKYLDWKNLISDDGRTHRVLEFVNEDNFDTFTQMHEAMENGDFEKSNEIRAKLGMTQGHGRSYYRN